MLHVTPTAQRAIRRAMAQAGTAPGGGLRITTNNDTPGEPGFQLTLVNGPEPEDRVAPANPRVYLEPATVVPLSDRVLDASDSSESICFRLREAA